MENHLRSRGLFVIVLLATLLFASASLTWNTGSSLKSTAASAMPLEKPDVQSSGYFVYDQRNNTFHTYGSQLNYRLQPERVTLILPTTYLDMQFLNTNPDVRISGQKPAQARANYFIGNDPAQWQRQAPLYSEVVYHALYPGIDLIYTLEGGRLKSEFRIAPGADPDHIHIQYAGQTALTLREDALDIQLPSGETLQEHIPSAYQDIDGQRQTLDVTFRLLDDATYTFALGEAYNPDYPLVIDPILIYSTYLGGSAQDEGWAIAVDKTGAMYITGITQSTDMPMIQPGEHKGGNDVFVAKVDQHGQLVYVSVFGGSEGEEGNGIAVDDAGNAYVGGETFSPEFPVLNAWQSYFAGYEDAFVLKVDAHGDLVYSTFLGGSRAEEIDDIIADSIGNVYLGGEVYSDDFPLVNPWSSNVYGVGDEDGFISVFNAYGELVYSTYVSASQRDQIFRIAVDHEGYVYGTGMTSSADFPLVNPFQSTYGGDWDDCFVFKLDPWTNTMFYSTFLGGSGRDECWGLAVDAEGAAYVTGFTLSTNFPMVNAFQNQHNGAEDAFAAKLSPAGNQLRFSTFIGGSDKDWAWGLDLDGDANVYVTGETYSPNFPLKDALQPIHKGNRDAFLMALTSDGALKYSSFLGGAGDERGWRLTVDKNWIVYVTGSTDSYDFPLKAAYQNQPGGETDAFVATFGLVPTPTPTPTPTPLPTPTPFASAEVGPEGALLWISYPGHITMLIIPENVLTTPSVITLTYDGRPDIQGDLQGNNHFFSITGTTQTDTSIMPVTMFRRPSRLILGYNERQTLIPNTIDLYRLTASGWTTENITKVEQSADYIIADIQWLGIYGLLGKTNRIYLPLTLRK